MSSSPSLALPVTAASRSPDGRRLDGEDGRVLGLATLRREVAAVVGGSLLVAERLEPVLQVPLELLVEFVGRDAQRFLVRRLAAADDALAQREQVLADAFLAPLGLDELEGGVPEVVDQARVGELAVSLELAHLRDDVGHRGIADGHQVERAPHAGHVVGQALVHPERHRPTHQRARDDVELEDVRELVRDQPIELVGRLVDRQHHAVARGLGKRRHAFLTAPGMTFCCWNSVCVLKISSGILKARSCLSSELSCW